MSISRLLLALAIFSSACAHVTPLPTTERAVAGDVARGFAEVFPEAAKGGQTLGLMRPRFGIPAILDGEDVFPIAVLEKDGPWPLVAALVRDELGAEAALACLAATAPSEDCVPLALAEESAIPVEDGHVLRSVKARAAGISPGRRYDLVLGSGGALVERARRSVFTRAKATEGAPLKMVQLSDLHLGREHVATRLERIVREVNELAPDLVIVTGDMAEQGHNAELEEQAARALQRLESPVLVIIGNHDYGHFPKIRAPRKPDYGYFHFARFFHPYRFFHTTIGGWDFVGFDSGPSIFSPEVRTRGISHQTLDQIKGAVTEAIDQHRGVILFSHAPTRAVMSSEAGRPGAHRLGTMKLGGEDLEQLLIDESQRGIPALHLSGHTHWSDLFVGESDGAGFTRQPFAKLTCPAAFDSPLLLVNAPSATRITFPTLAHGQHFGFVELQLGRRSQVRFHLYDREGRSMPCAESVGSQAATSG